MSLGRRLISTGAEAACLTETTDIFGDSSGVALYSLDYDASDAGDTYNGTPSNVTFGVGGQINYGARFNGSSSKIVTGFSLYNISTVSLSGWVNINSFTSTPFNVNMVFGTTQTTNASQSVQVNSDGTVRFRLQDSTGENASTTSNSLNVNQWHHIAVTWDKTIDSGKLKIYIDGTEASYSSTGNQTNDTNEVGDLVIGHQTSLYFDGDIDQVRIFNRALSTDNNGVNEIATLYAETACVHTSTTDQINYPTTNVAYYKLDNSSEDYAGSNDGTDTNIEYRFGRYGQAAVFSGNGYISGLPTVQNTSGEFSVSMWFNTTVNPSVQHTMLGGIKEQGTNDSVFALKMLDDGYSKLYLRGTDGTLHILADTVDATDGNWHHLVATVSSSSGVFYVDGQQVDSATISNNITVDNLLIGAENNRGTLIPVNYFNGSIDQVRIYSTVLDAEQVTKLYEEKQDYITKDASDPFGDTNSVALYEMENNGNDTLDNHNATSTTGVTFSATEPVRGTYAAEFSGGTSGSVVVPNSTDLAQQNNFTFSAWFKTDTTGVMQTIYAFNSPSTYQSGIFIHSNGTNNIRIFSAGSNYYSSNNVYTANQWYHIVFTKSSSSGIVVYLDSNVVINEPTATANHLQPAVGDNRIGGYKTGSVSLTFDGELDHVRIFDRALDGTEAYKLYAEGARGTGL